MYIAEAVTLRDVDKKIDNLAQVTNQRFVLMDEKFKIIIETMREGFALMEKKAVEADERHYELVVRISDTFTHIENRFQVIEARLDTLKVEIITEVTVIFNTVLQEKLQENNKALLVSLREQL